MRKNLEKIDLIAIPLISGQQPNNLKGAQKFLPYVNEWARSVLALTTLYVSKLKYFVIYICKNAINKFQFQFGMIFIFVDAYIWHTFTKDMKPEEFWTTFKGMHIIPKTNETSYRFLPLKGVETKYIKVKFTYVINNYINQGLSNIKKWFYIFDSTTFRF